MRSRPTRPARRAGEAEASLEGYRAVISDDPDNSRAWINLAVKFGPRLDQSEIKAIGARLSRDDCSDEEKAGLHFGVLAFLGKQLRQTDILLAAAVVGVLVVLILPMPSWLLDFSLAVSITFSVMILMTCLFIQLPLEFSSFPTVLLLALPQHGLDAVDPGQGTRRSGVSRPRYRGLR